MSEPERVGEIDLAPDGQRDGPFAQLYETVAREVRADYAALMGSVSEDFAYPLDWWLQGPASRSPILSSLFHEVVSLITLQQLVKAGNPPQRIATPHPAMMKAVTTVLAEYASTTRVAGPDLFKRGCRLLRSRLSSIRSIGRLFLEWLLIKSTTSSGQRQADVDGNILIDTFALPGYVEQDRYYPGLLDLAGSSRERVRFVPQFHGFKLRDLRRAATSLRQLPHRFLIKENWIGFRDLLWIFAHLIRIRRRRKRPVWFRDVEISGLITASISRHGGTRCAMRGLVNYRFARALALAGQRPDRVIDWFENHPMDRGWNAGFNQWFRDTPRIGYIGFFPAGQNYRPSLAEGNADLLPETLATISRHFFPDVEEFNPGKPLDVAPAFRYQASPEPSARQPVGGRVLVVLPYFATLSIRLIEAARVLQQSNGELDIVIRAHPAQPLEQLINLAELEKFATVETSGSMPEALQAAEVVVSAAQASTLLESAAAGVPAVVLSEPGSRLETALPGGIPESLYRVCYSIAELSEMTNRHLNLDTVAASQRSQDARAFSSSYFEPVTPGTVQSFLEKH